MKLEARQKLQCWAVVGTPDQDTQTHKKRIENYQAHARPNQICCGEGLRKLALKCLVRDWGVAERESRRINTQIAKSLNGVNPQALPSWSHGHPISHNGYQMNPSASARALSANELVMLRACTRRSKTWEINLRCWIRGMLPHEFPGSRGNGISMTALPKLNPIC